MNSHKYVSVLIQHVISVGRHETSSLVVADPGEAETDKINVWQPSDYFYRNKETTLNFPLVPLGTNY